MKRILSWLVLMTLLASVFPRPAWADGGEGGDPGQTSSLWGEIFDKNGKMLPTVVDKGVVTEEVDWMPGILGGKAEYHVYVAANGNTVVMPSATTLFFMALNADESGLKDASAYLQNGAGSLVQSAGSLLGGPKEALAAMLQATGAWDEVKDDYVSPEQFADEMISGRKKGWSLGPFGDVGRILWFFSHNSWEDKSLYTTILLYTPDNCSAAPGGCPAEALAAIATPPPPPPSECAPAKVHQGRISGTGRVAAPNYPLVVGQDPNKRGADLEFTLTIEPTIYIWYEAVQRSECRYVAAGTGGGCPAGLSHDAGTVSNPYYQVYTWTDCVRHTATFPETANWVKATATLSHDSREWITRGSLGIRYPGAYLHHPEWWWFNPPQAERGISGYTYHWRFLVQRVQVADPGTYNLILDGYTSGTPVSSGRPFHFQLGTFQVAVFTSTLHR